MNHFNNNEKLLYLEAEKIRNELKSISTELSFSTHDIQLLKKYNSTFEKYVAVSNKLATEQEKKYLIKEKRTSGQESS